MLALVFNISNAVGFTYAYVSTLLPFIFIFAHFDITIPISNHTPKNNYLYSDRDAKQRWANQLASSGWSMGMGGLGGQILSGVVKNSVGRVFR